MSVQMLNMIGDLLPALTEEYGHCILTLLRTDPRACQALDLRRAQHEPRASKYCLQALIRKGLALKRALEELQREAARAPYSAIHGRR